MQIRSLFFGYLMCIYILKNILINHSTDDLLTNKKCCRNVFTLYQQRYLEKIQATFWQHYDNVVSWPGDLLMRLLAHGSKPFSYDVIFKFFLLL